MRWRRAPFTAAQWEELEQQALIFKYFLAGVPLPPHLLLAVQQGVESFAGARLYSYPSLGYGSYYGKKIDPEPGRCRRTDGKKWRCAKEAARDSRYCERHMHRGKNRSRKPVAVGGVPPPAAAAAVPQSPSPSASTVTSLTPSSENGVEVERENGIGSGSGSGNGNENYLIANPGSSSSQHQMDFRFTYGVRSGLDEQSFFSEASGDVRGLGMDSSTLFNNNSMQLTLTQPSPYSQLDASYAQLATLQDIKPFSFSGSGSSEYGIGGTVKQENQFRSFFDESSNFNAFSSTQLSISLPMASPEFCTTTSSHSPNLSSC